LNNFVADYKECPIPDIKALGTVVSGKKIFEKCSFETNFLTL